MLLPRLMGLTQKMTVIRRASKCQHRDVSDSAHRLCGASGGGGGGGSEGGGQGRCLQTPAAMQRVMCDVMCYM